MRLGIFFVILVSIVSIVSIGLIVSIILFNKLKCKNNLKLVQFALKKYLKDFHNVCERHSISYWADSGTLLGAVRDRGIIPHDDDVDVCVYKDEMLKLIDLYKNDSEYHIVPDRIEDGTINKLKRIDINDVWIDIFIVEKNSHNKIRYKYKNHRDWWPKQYYKEDEIYPLNKIRFEDFMISVPNNPIPYLERSYGNWKIPVIYERH